MKLYSKISVLLAVTALATMNISASTVTEEISINSLNDESSPYTVEFKFNSVWEGGRTGEIIIKNMTDQPLINWQLDFELDANIKSAWNAKMERTSNKYSLMAEPYNATIYPGQSVTIGFECEWLDGDMIPEKYILIGDGEVILDTNHPKDVINNISSPQMLDLDIPSSLSFATDEDEIWFSFRPDATESYEFICEGNANLSMTLFDKTKNKVVASNVESSDTKLLANTLIKSKEYFVKVVPVGFRADECEFSLEVKQCDRPNDTFFDKQWALLNDANGIDINILPVWKYLSGNTETVSISDSGTYCQHEDLGDNMNVDLSYNFVHDIPNVFPENEIQTGTSPAIYGHGTHVAGIIGAEVNNNMGIAGVIPDAEMVSYKILGTPLEDDDTYIHSTVTFINSIEAAKANNIRIMNCSFGGSYPSVIEREIMKEADDILFVIAAGNDGEDLGEIPTYPACYYNDNSLVVANVDMGGQLSYSSNYGGPTDIGAPGSDIASTMPYDQYMYMSGTSMATPYVAGVCGLVLAENPSLSSVDLKYYITNPMNVTPLKALEGTTISGGFLNAYKAVVTPNTTYAPRSISSFRDPFSGDVKSKINHYKDIAPDDTKTNQLIVSIKDDTSIDEWIDTLNKEHGIENVEVKQYIESVNIYVLECSSIEECDATVEALNSYDSIKYAEPNYSRK